MRIALASDLHLEFGPINLVNDQNVDVLVLSGDITTARQLKEGGATSFFQNVSAQFPHVVYVLGNHEFYHGDWQKAPQRYKDFCAQFPNVHFLDNEFVDLGDTRFYGATLWTDCNKRDPLTLHALADLMTDFKVVHGLVPASTATKHEYTLECAHLFIKDHDNVVFVGHHAPSPLSTPAEFKGHQLTNGGYCSDLSEFILDHPQIKIWTHGHMHDPSDYMIGSTRVVANPRGYIGYETRANNFKLKVL